MDQGTEFLGAFKEYCNVFNPGFSRAISVRNPRANGSVERQNRTLSKMIRGFCNSDCKSTWSAHIPSLQIAYNAAVNATGYSPAYLMFAR
eukprot:scaffold8227_cov477-Pinguiococcus_pyrenoidosus.AAC.1